MTITEWWNCFRYILTPFEPKIQGVWQRVGDKFAGCQIEIVKGDLVNEGRIIRLNEEMKRYGWKIGDLKWRNPRQVGKRDFQFDDLFKTYHRDTKATESEYKEASIWFVTPNMLTVRSGESTQRWMRVRS